MKIVGTAWYANGERMAFTDPVLFIKTVEEELSDRYASGFSYQLLDADSETRKSIDDLVYLMREREGYFSLLPKRK